MALQGVFVVFVTESPDSGALFMQRYFGFDAVVDLGWYVHVKHECGAEIGFMASGNESQPQPYRVTFSGVGMILTLEVNDADAELDRLATLGLEATLPIVTEEWGQRHFGVVGPGGIMIDVVQALSEET